MTVDLSDSRIAQRFEAMLVDGVESFCGPCDRSSASVERFDFDESTGIVDAKFSVRAANSEEAVAHFSIPTTFRFKYDMTTAEMFDEELSIETKVGNLDIDIGNIRKVLEGDISAALELIPNGGLVERKIDSEYDDRKAWYQNKYSPPKTNIYFASSDFVRWASPVTAGKWIAALIASGGSAASAITSEARAMARKELTHIVTWLKLNGASNAEQVGLDIVNGNSVGLPQIKLVWQRVMYSSVVKVGPRKLPSTPPLPHAAFVLVWTNTSSPPVVHSSGTGQMADDSGIRTKWSLAANYAIGPTGSRITFIKPGGAADSAGLVANDVVLEVEGSPVGVTDNSTDLLGSAIKDSDQQITIRVLRESGNTEDITVSLDPII